MNIVLLFFSIYNLHFIISLKNNNFPLKIYCHLQFLQYFLKFTSTYCTVDANVFFYKFSFSYYLAFYYFYFPALQNSFCPGTLLGLLTCFKTGFWFVSSDPGSSMGVLSDIPSVETKSPFIISKYLSLTATG